MNVNAKLLVTGDYGEENRATFNGFLFDGNASAENAVGGRDAFIEVRVYISNKLTSSHGQSDHLSRRFRSLISERYSR